MTNLEEVFPVDEEKTFLNALVTEAANGKDESFSILAKRFTPALLAMIASYSMPEDETEDLMQEGLIGLYKAVRLYKPELSSFPVFARICMRSALADSVRKYRKNGEELEATEEWDSFPASSTETPERILMGKEDLLALLRKVDDALSPMERKIFGLHLQGRNSVEIASLTGKDVKSVENALYRLRRKLSATV